MASSSIGRGAPRRWIALVTIVAVSGLAAGEATGAAAPRAHAAKLSPARMLSLLNLQRKANGIPAIRRLSSRDVGWCPNERRSHAFGVFWPVVAGTGYGSWSTSSSPWSSAPAHQYPMYSPVFTTAGAAVRDGFSCMGFTGRRAEPPHPVAYAFYSETGPEHVPPTEVVVNERPYTQQEWIGIREGRATGPQMMLYVAGLGPKVHATSVQLKTAAGHRVRGVHVVDQRTAAAHGRPQDCFQGGVLIPPKLKPNTSYRGQVVWVGSGGRKLVQKLAFTTLGIDNAIDLDGVRFTAAGLEVDAYSQAPGALITVTDPAGQRRQAPLKQTTATFAGVTPAAGAWQVCVDSGGPPGPYGALDYCWPVTVSADGTTAIGKPAPAG